MYGKHFESMYEGSMYGAGVAVFAVWGYVIAHTRKSRVELNPKKLSDTLGGTISEIESAIKFLMSPDKNSRHNEHEGRRLIKEGEFQYFLPSWAAYQQIRNADERREYNRMKQAEYRAKRNSNPMKRSSGSRPLKHEVAAVKAYEEGNVAEFERLAALREMPPQYRTDVPHETSGNNQAADPAIAGS